jgi:hypothetical protein
MCCIIISLCFVQKSKSIHRRLITFPCQIIGQLIMMHLYEQETPPSSLVILIPMLQYTFV